MTEEAAAQEGEEVLRNQADEAAAEAEEKDREIEQAEQAEDEDTGDSSTPPAESDDAESEEDGDDAEDKPKKGGVQKRIDELVREREEARQREQRYRQELEQMRTQQRRAQLHASKPRVEDYDSVEDFERDYEQWVASGLKQQRQAEQEAREQYEREQQELEKQHALRVKTIEAQKAYPDFNEVISDPSVPSLPEVNEHAFEALSDSDRFADVAYYLAKHPEEIEKFRGLSPVQAGRRMARIEARFDKPKPKAEPSSAPEPAPRTRTRGSGPKNLSEIKSTDKWMEERQRQVSNRK